MAIEETTSPYAERSVKNDFVEEATSPIEHVHYENAPDVHEEVADDPIIVVFDVNDFAYTGKEHERL